jgi:hypothetical protein
MKNNLKLALLLAIGLAAGSNLWGQAMSGTVVGRVTDPSGSAVPGASVTVINDGTHLTRTVTTNAEGDFRANDFPTGSLTVTVEHGGFAKLVRAGLQLAAADTITVNLQLNIGDVQQTVQVTAEASLVQSQSAAVTTLVSNQQIMETPLIGRSFTQMLQVVSGASPTTAGMTEGLSSYGMRASTSVSLNGSTAQNNSYMVDGIDDVAPWLNNLVVVPPLDAVQEQRLEGANYSAEFGSAAGAVTVVQTKSGTNQLHGTAYEFVRNNDFNANTFFGNKTGTPITEYRRNQFGANVGGRIIKDKSFFFVDYEGTRVVQPTLTTTTIPTAAEQQMVETGNFGAFSTTVYDPGTNVGGLRTPFPGNEIPATRLDPAAVRLFQLLPAPTNSGTANNFSFAPYNGKRVDQFDTRFDQNLFSADRLFFKFAYENTTGVGSGQLPAPRNPPFPTGPYVSLGSGFAGNSQMNDWSLTANYVKVISPAIVDEFRAGAVRTDLSNLLWDNSLPISTELGIPNLNISNTQMGFPAITLPGFMGAGSSTSSTSNPMFGSTSSYPELQHAITYQYQDIVSINKGTHFMKFGVEFYRDDFDGHTSNSPRGYFDFDGQYTRQIGSSSATTALSDFALGAWDGSQRSTQYGIFGARRWRLAAFAEDSWRVNGRLTVNYGLRYEFQGPWGDVFDRWSDVNVVTGQAITPTSSNNHCGASMICPETKDFAPRAGIVYALTKDQKTVFRAGSGFGYFNGDNGGKMMQQNPPMSVIQQFATNASAAPNNFLSQGLPLPVQPNLSDPTQLTYLPYAWDPHLKLARNMQWSAGIQREIVTDLLLDVAYVGSRTNDMLDVVNANQAAPGPGALGPRRPLYTVNPALGDISLRTNYGAAKYHSLQVNLRKRYSHGLTGTVAYTWSHNMTNTSGPNSNDYPQNDRCYKCEWGDAPEDRNEMLMINHVYQFPFGAGRQFVNKGLLSHVIGDWDLSGLWTMYTGLHFNPSMSTSVSGSLGSPLVNPVERPNLNGTPNLPADQRSITHWFNVSAFSIPAAYTFGNSGYDVLVGPGLMTADLGLHRTFLITESKQLTFRWEVFNAFNRANFSNPSAVIGSSAAGTISATNPARTMQLALRLTF